MSFARAVPSSLSCHSCRTSLLRTFTPHNAAPLRASWTTPPRRAFNSATDPNISIETATGEVELPEETPTAPKSHIAPIPWYLQDRPVTSTDSDGNSRSLLPTLPKNPPPLLQTLLEYISVTAGLDDLLLYDLRHLDPPPALGSKLIMIMGTARSEKHLHVAADRFCRYLRREHGLRANAAGLLGRNELKIKLRRKAKRMKMLANVGGGRDEPVGNLDDGIRTGWICCTIGRIEAHPDDVEVPDQENFVGFRNVQSGVNVVVQMFTEEKRDETDLETLWGGVLKTHERNHSAVEDGMIKELDEHIGHIGGPVERDSDFEAVEKVFREARNERLVVDVSSKPFDPRETPSTIVAEHSNSSWDRTAPSKGDAFPVFDLEAGRQTRRLHTVGLTRSL